MSREAEILNTLYALVSGLDGWRATGEMRPLTDLEPKTVVLWPAKLQRVGGPDDAPRWRLVVWVGVVTRLVVPKAALQHPMADGADGVREIVEAINASALLSGSGALKFEQFIRGDVTYWQSPKREAGWPAGGYFELTMQWQEQE